MRGHGLDAHVQLRANVAGRLSRGDEAEHLELAVGKALVPLGVGGVENSEGETLGQLRRQVPLAGGDLRIAVTRWARALSLLTYPDAPAFSTRVAYKPACAC